KSSWGWCCSAWLWVWIVGSPQFVIWTTITLMDVGLWTCVFVLGSLATVKAISRIPKRMGEDRSVMLWIGLMSLTRSEGLYLCLIWIAVLGWGRWRRHDPYSRSVRDRLRSIRGPVLTYLGVNFCVIGIRYFYFGYPFPNTYYAKVSPELFYNLKLGVGYAWLFLKFQPWVIPCIGLVFWQASRFIRGQCYRESGSHAVTPQQSSDAALAVITLLAMVCPVLTGGDHFDYARFFQPCWPLLGLVGIGAFGKLMTSWKFTENGMNGKSVTLVLVLAAALLLVQKPSWIGMLRTRGHDTQMRHDFVLALRGRELGQLLNGFSSRLEKSDGVGQLYVQPMLLGTLTTGGVGYTYKGPKFDVLGLNDVRMAHSSGDRRGNKNHAAFDKDVFLERMPDMFAAKPVQKLPREGRHIFPSQNSFWQESLLQLDKDPRFLKSYTPVAIRLYVRHASSQKLAMPMITAWLRTDFLNQIRHETSSYTIEVLP
ncbi:MAG: hypothetical protein VX738_06095, partial [Planctomycetota bacterium]|nr:hypothetical protein [Planctomycetota bacterium]